ncbi:hypothetical protein ACNKHX_02660 [Shigella flexneri]
MNWHNILTNHGTGINAGGGGNLDSPQKLALEKDIFWSIGRAIIQLIIVAMC